MANINLFSRRQRELRGEVPDVYTYDTISHPLKVQVVHIWGDALGNEHDYSQHSARHATTFKAYRVIVETLCREFGVLALPSVAESTYIRNYRTHGRRFITELYSFFLENDNTEQLLDTIELSFRYIDKITRKSGREGSVQADDAIAELNTRFRQHGIGYEYDDGEIIRIDSQLLHAETVKPALRLLRESAEYAGAQAEFLTAHEHYRHGRLKEVLTECLKALESLMKVICIRRGWSFPSNATAKGLVQVLFDNGLVPAFWQQHFSALRSTLEAGVPTARNKLSGHGQGVAVVEVPEYLVSYMLHLTASAMVFLAAADTTSP